MRVIQLLGLTCISLVALASAPAQAAPQWREASSDHFIVYADASEKWLRSFAERLEKFDSGLRYLRGMEILPRKRSNRLLIYVVASQTAVRNLCGANCNYVSGFYVPHIGGSVAFTPRDTDSYGFQGLSPEIVLFHEYGHHFLMANSSGAHPGWLNEGFAEFNSTAQETRDGSMCFGRPAQHRAYEVLRGAKLSIEAVLDSGARKFNGSQQSVFYGRSWTLTHYLTFDEARSGQLSLYLDAFNQGKNSLEAARLAFGDLAKLDKELDAYIRRNAFRCLQVTADHLSTGRINIRLLTAGEAATMPLRMRLGRGLDKQKAVSLTAEARTAAKAFADDAGAQTLLAGVEYEAGNLDEADAAADRALAADPNAFGALLYKGRIAIQRIEKTDSGDDRARDLDPATAWNTARSWFIKANTIDNDDAEALYRFYMSFMQQGLKPTDNAEAALRQAYRLAPQDNELRWTFAQHLLLKDRTADARIVLMPLAHAPHQDGDNRALAMVQAIDAGATGPQVIEAGARDSSP